MKKVSKEGEVRLLICCLQCNRENYSMMVIKCQCAWCGYDDSNDDDEFKGN